MCIKLNNMQIWIFFSNRSHSSQCNRMLSTNHKRNFPILQNFCRFILNILQRTFRISKRKFQISSIKNLNIFQILILIRTIRFYPKTLISHNRRSKSSPWSKRSCAVKWCSKNSNFALIIFIVTSYKCMYIFIFHINSPYRFYF